MRVGIIGLGTIGRVHKSVLTAIGEDIVAVCDMDTNVLSKYSEVKCYTDYREMLAKENLDVVHICTPHYLHTEMILAALERDIHVLCEKPMCIKREDVPLILAAEKRSKGRLGVCHQNRYNNVNAYLKEYLKDKKIISAHGELIWCRGKAYYAQAEWRGKKVTEGGGVLINQALHTLDLMQWFCGMPKTICARTDNLTLQGIIDVEDTAMLFCKGDVNFTFFATNTGGADMPTAIRLTLSNCQNIVVYPDKLFIDGKIVTEEDMHFFLGKCCYGNGHEKLIADFYNCIKQEKPFMIDGTEASKVCNIIFDAYDSNGEKINRN
ncbi:MAG: Gfo/Idh/MocA family oxidoreductase [Clostridia bacterium]|nr:Gfo/Idh/MocA family oxidoreductase [Clostridia bacterium]